MKAKRNKLNQILPKAISAFLVFWLSSILVFVCCGLMASEVSAQETIPECHKHLTEEKSDDADKISETEKDKADCCAFKPTKTLSSDLQNSKNIKQSQSVTEKIVIPKPVYFIKQTYQSPSVYHSAIRNRGSTYLQNCVFRI